MCIYAHRADVAQLDIHVSLGSPSSIIGEFLQTELIGPYLYALHRTSVVAYAYHDGFYFSQSGVTHDGYAVGGVVVIVFREQACHAGLSQAALCVACLLQSGEDIQVYVEHVFLWPNGSTSRWAVSVIDSLGRELQGHFVFVEVALVIGA